MTRRSSKLGQSILEVLIAIFIGALLFVGAASLVSPTLQTNKQSSEEQTATALAKQLLDNTRVFSEGSWSGLLAIATGSTNWYHFSATSSPFVATSSGEMISVGSTTYCRYFTLDDIYRDGNGNVTTTASGNTYDPSTKSVTVNTFYLATGQIDTCGAIGWATSSLPVYATLQTYLTRWNTAVNTQSDWSGGALGAVTTSQSNVYASTSIAINVNSAGALSLNLSQGQSSVLICTNGWSSTQALPYAVDAFGSAAYNGYLYVAGGYLGGTTYTSTVLFAPINGNGTVGSWTPTKALPFTPNNPGMAVYNGYLYLIGGAVGSGGTTSTVLYAPINATGSLGAWTVTQALPFTNEPGNGVAVYNGYLYTVGGLISTAGVRTSTVLYAPINATGSLGAWTVTHALPSKVQSNGAVAYGGYLYSAGGYNGSADTSTVLFAQINGDGTIGAWTPTQALPYTEEGFPAVAYRGYIYGMGNFAAGIADTSTTLDALINANGTLGSWTSTRALPYAADSFGSAAYNGYLYAIGGFVSNFTSTVLYCH